MRPQPDMAKFGEGVMDCLGENQRKIAKFFEDEMSAVVIAAAPVLKPLTASIKPAGKDERKTAEAAGVDAVPPVATRRRARQKRKSKAVPFVTRGPASDVRHGTIVGVNHEKETQRVRFHPYFAEYD